MRLQMPEQAICVIPCMLRVQAICVCLKTMCTDPYKYGQRQRGVYDRVTSGQQGCFGCSVSSKSYWLQWRSCSHAMFLVLYVLCEGSGLSDGINTGETACGLRDVMLVPSRSSRR